MNMVRKGQVRWLAQDDIVGQVKFIESLFGIAAWLLLRNSTTHSSPTFTVCDTTVERVLAVPGTDRDQLLLTLVYAAGLRVSEPCRLKWRNVQCTGKRAQVTLFGKGSRTRSVVLPTRFCCKCGKEVFLC
jgi:site-specific recombinase XerC